MSITSQLTEIPSSHKMERLSVAYVSAITAKAGIKLSGLEAREYGIDGYMQRIRKLKNGKYKETGHLLPIQIKSTTTSDLKGDDVVYGMEADAYNKLIDTLKDDLPTVLILFRIPKDEHEWLINDEEKLLLKNCCYWVYIPDGKSVKSKKRIFIPRSQIFTPEAAQDLFLKLREGYFNGYSSQ